jgi:iron(III) transport system substrate-binding protein
MLNTSQNQENSLKFIEYLLGEKAQTYFSTGTLEYPLASSIAPDIDLIPLDNLNSLDIDLIDLADIQGTIQLMQEVGMLP